MRKEIREAILEGMKARGNGSCCGAGRAYVCIGKTDRKTLNAFKAACADVGRPFIKKAYGSGTNVLYVGYDNFTGTPIAQARAIAANLNAIGVSCYDDAVGD
jgi:hypothetical protein